jgi:hypothetical protein
MSGILLVVQPLPIGVREPDRYPSCRQVRPQGVSDQQADWSEAGQRHPDPGDSQRPGLANAEFRRNAGYVAAFAQAAA